MTRPFSGADPLIENMLICAAKPVVVAGSANLLFSFAIALSIFNSYLLQITYYKILVRMIKLIIKSEQGVTLIILLNIILIIY